MAIHPLRVILRKIGFDIHRHRTAAEPMEYLRTLGIKTVIDVGANIGQFSTEIREILPDAHIIAFEPLKDCFEKLERTMARDTRFEAHNVALGDKNEETTIHRSSYSQSSSLLSMAELHRTLFPHTAGETSERVHVRRMDDVLADKGLQKNILLKIDVQGYEDKVLAGSSRTLSETKAVLIEASFVPLYEGQPLFEGIHRLMDNAGFSYRGALHQKCNPKTGEILFEDALFLHR